MTSADARPRCSRDSEDLQSNMSARTRPKPGGQEPPYRTVSRPAIRAKRIDSQMALSSLAGRAMTRPAIRAKRGPRNLWGRFTLRRHHLLRPDRRSPGGRISGILVAVHNPQLRRQRTGEDFDSITGKEVRAIVAGRSVLVGTATVLAENGIDPFLSGWS